MGCGASASHTPQAPHQEGSPVVPFNSDTSSSAQTEKKAVPMAAFRQEEGSTKVKLLSPQPTPVHLSRQKRSRGSVACYLSQNTIVNGVLARPPDEVLPYLAVRTHVLYGTIFVLITVNGRIRQYRRP